MDSSLKVVIKVEDTGVGIDEHTRQKIFSLFDNFKIKNIVNSGGCGIGLTLSKKLCDLMGYDISFKSTQN